MSVSGERAVSGDESGDGTLRLWELDWEPAVRDDKKTAGGER